MGENIDKLENIFQHIIIEKVVETIRRVLKKFLKYCEKIQLKALKTINIKMKSIVKAVAVGVAVGVAVYWMYKKLKAVDPVKSEEPVELFESYEDFLTREESESLKQQENAALVKFCRDSFYNPESIYGIL